ncbi:TPA: hypothetical protein DCZ39_07475 [Patescibacteria group bacterium]|nr:hypothetical protein [Candidatus Gracilibacteria bacterium]
MRNITVNDDTCGPVVYISGDVNNDGRLELTEKWYYRCTTTLSATTTNIVTVYGESDDSYRDVATDTATATVVVGAVVVDTGVHAAPLTPPLINIIKIPNRLTPFPFGGGDVTYTYTVTNPGIVAMNDIVVTDDKCGPIALIGGDTNYDHLLDINESWVYTCQSNISVSTRNVAIAEGKANGFIVQDQTFANVYVTPGLPKTGLSITPWHIIVLASILMIISTSLIFVFKKKTI